MEKITFIMGSVFPVPATKGGAVENLVENIIKEQEQKKKIDLNVICVYDKNAEIMSKGMYKNTKFYFVKINRIFKIIDKFISVIATKFLKKKNVMTYSFIVQRLVYYRKISVLLHKNDFGKIVLENSTGLYLSLKWKHNYLKYKNQYYYHCHNKVNMYFNCKNIINSTNKFISVSKFMTKDLMNFLNTLDKNKFTTLKNSIDETKFNKEVDNSSVIEIKSKYKINSNDKVIIFVGRLTEEKGIKHLLMAINCIKDKNIKLLIVGSYFFNTKVNSDFRNDLEKLICKNKNRIIFTGYVNYDDIYKFYNIADIAILPSMWEEPAGLTIQEAEMCGLPIITTNSGGIPEYVNDKFAIIIDRDENIVNSLVKEIKEIIYDKKRLKKMSKSALEFSKQFNLSNYYENFISIIEENDY